MPKEAPSITQTLASLTNNTHKPASLKIHFPSTNTTVSSPGTLLTKDATAELPIYSVSASALGHLSFHNCDLSPTTSASTESSMSQPRRGSGISLQSSPDESTPKYMVVSLDLDAPFPSVPLISPVLHGLQTDMTLSTENLDPDDEFIPLQMFPSSGDVTADVVDYMGPAPPPPSSPHRYMFMLWEQPAGLTRAKICEELGISSEGSGHEDMGIMSRLRWDQEKFEKKVGLGRVVAGNYFVC